MWKLGFGLIGLLLVCSARQVYAQAPADRPRFEIGAQLISSHLKELSSLDRHSEIGAGGRFAMNLGELLAAETELDFSTNDSMFPERRRLQALFGVKAGARRQRVGIFGKFRPGFMHVRDRSFCAIPEFWVCGPPRDKGRFSLALDVGGVFEVYPSRRFALRFDAGDTVLRRWSYSDGTGRDYYFTSHNLQIGTGAALRF